MVPKKTNSLLLHAGAICALAALPAGCTLESDDNDHISQESAAATIPAGTDGITPILGSGWNTSQERTFVQCVKSEPPLLVGSPSSNVQMDISVDSQTATNSLGFSAEVKAHYGLYSGSIAANFASSLQSDDFSKTFIYRSEYFGKSQQLNVNNFQLTPIGLAAQQNGNWADSCGDEGVTQIDYAGKFFLIYKLEFQNHETKQEFDAKIDGSAPFGSVKAQLEMNKQLFVKNTKLHVSAYQFGGDPTQISQIFTGIPGDHAGDIHGEEGNVQAALECSLTDLDSCNKFMVNATLYATSTTQGFPKQLAQMGYAPTRYLTQPWTMLQIAQPPMIVTQALRGARNDLLALYDRNGKLLRRVTALAQDFPNEEESGTLNQWATKLSGQDRRIFQIVKVCYDDVTQRSIPGNDPTHDPDLTRTVTDCVNAVADLKAAPPAGLEFPPDLLLDSYGKDKPLVKAWVDMGGKDSVIGRPKDAAFDLPNGGVYRRYVSGSLCYNPDTGVQVVRSPINAKATDALLMFLNCPTGPATAGGLKQEFQGGTIEINSATGAATVTLRKIEGKAVELGSSTLGNKVGTVVVVPPEAVAQRYDNGVIYLTPGEDNGGDAFLMARKNFEKLLALPQALRVSLGHPIADSASRLPNIPSHPKYSRLEHGGLVEEVVHEVPTQNAHYMNADFFGVWLDNISAFSPVSDPTANAGGTMVPIGNNSVILSKDGLGTFYVSAAVWDKLTQHFSLDVCGYPKTALLPAGPGKQIQTYERGSFTVTTVNHGGGVSTVTVTGQCP